MNTQHTPNLSDNIAVTRGGKKGFRALYFFALIVVIALIWVWRGLYVPARIGMTDKGFSTVTIEAGTGTSAIADQLAEDAIIRNAFLFKAYARATGKAASLQAGVYEVPFGSTAVEVLDQITGGDVVSDTVQVRIIEGWRADKMYPALEEAGLQFTEAEWERAVFGADGALNVVLPEPYASERPADQSSVEGFLFPDTYEFAVDATAVEVAQKMVDTFARKVGEAVPNIEEVAADLDMNAYEVVVLASIIEREVIDIDEREIAAGIFLQRIEDNYPLQSDATVEYVTKTERVETSFAETKVDSPWNTYVNTGLPPTPISSPAISAIEAIANAQFTNYYFFLTTPEGDAIFSVTYEEHLVNKAKYYPN